MTSCNSSTKDDYIQAYSLGLLHPATCLVRTYKFVSDGICTRIFALHRVPV